MRLPVRRSGLALVTLSLLLLVAAACSDNGEVGPGPLGPVGPVGEDEGIEGSGTVVAEAREVADFTGIVFASEGRVVVTIAGEAGLVIEVDDNLQQYLGADVSNGVLSLSTASDVDIAPSEPPVFNVSVTEVDTVVLAGAGSIDVAPVAADRLELTLSGVGDITLPSVTATEVVAEVTGVGNLAVSGTANRLVLATDGVTTFEGADLESRTVEVVAAGTSQARVWAAEEIEIRASGTARVEYYGPPAATVTTEDNASIARLGERP